MLKHITMKKLFFSILLLNIIVNTYAQEGAFNKVTLLSNKMTVFTHELDSILKKSITEDVDSTSGVIINSIGSAVSLLQKEVNTIDTANIKEHTIKQELLIIKNTSVKIYGLRRLIFPIQELLESKMDVDRNKLYHNLDSIIKLINIESLILSVASRRLDSITKKVNFPIRYNLYRSSDTDINYTFNSWNNYIRDEIAATQESEEEDQPKFKGDLYFWDKSYTPYPWGKVKRTIDIIPDIAEDDCKFCGYRVLYNPCTNCTNMFLNDCEDEAEDNTHYCTPKDPCNKYDELKTKKEKFIQVGKPFQYRLVGIDLGTHDVEINHEIISDNNPGDIALLTFQLLNGIPYADLSTVLNNYKFKNDYVYLAIKKDMEVESFPSCTAADENKQSLRDKKANLDAILLAFRKTGKLPSGIDTLKLISEIESVSKEYNENKNKCAADKLKVEYETNKMEYDNVIDEVNSVFGQLADYFALKINNNCTDLSVYDTELKTILDNIKTTFKCDSWYDPVSCLNSLIKEKRIPLEKTISKIKDAKLEKYFDDFDVVVKSVKDNEAIVTKNKELISKLFIKKDIYTQISIPEIDRFTDAIKININVAPKENNKGGTFVKATHTFYTRGGWDFSAGTGILVTGLRNPTYSFIQDTEDGEAGYRLARNFSKSGISSINLGVSVQSFFMFRFPYHIYVGPTIGAGVTFGIDRSQISGSMLFGGALMFGTYPKIALSCGFALSSIQRPDASYNIPDFPGAQSPVFFKGDKPANIDYTLSFKPNWFVSLTVNFGKPPVKPTPLEPTGVKKKEEDTAAKTTKEEKEKQESNTEEKEVIKVVEDKTKSMTIPADFKFKKISIKN